MSEPETTETAEIIEPTKAELQDELREAGLPVSGTKAELIERLETAEATEPDEAAEPDLLPTRRWPPLIERIKAPDLAEVAEEILDTVAEAVQRLGEAATALDVAQAAHTDPAGAAVRDAAGRVRAHMDDVTRNLGPLGAAAQALIGEVSALAAAAEATTEG